MKDGFGRDVDYLRLSVTDRCNLRCIYCMPQSGIPLVDSDDILTVDETAELVRIIVQTAGIKKLRITGGEPLVRKGILKIVKEVSKIPLEEVTLTTNGILLPNIADSLKKNGITRVNISVDSLRDEALQNITRRRVTFSNIESAVSTAKAAGMTPVKINCVVLRTLNSAEIPDFLEWGASMDIIIRFIEHMPICLPKAEFVSKEEILNSVHTIGKCTKIESNGTAELYRMDETGQIFGIIAPISGNMCRNCSRLRLTARGKLISCLTQKPICDLKKMLRADAAESEIADVVCKAIKSKPEFHNGCGRIKMWKVGG